MSVIKRIIRNIFNWANTEEINPCAEPKEANYYGSKTMSLRAAGIGSSNRGVPFEEANRGMNFTIYNATGGKVVQLFSYNPNTDRSNTSLYIIGDKDNFGEELAMIVTRENLTR